ncbi:MAG TPA: glycosyltransferase [Rhizomicrobium sp.]|jgi:spore maturation protein CgeB|nr:glycosyltransferase [Rhizomicrobium sp.]
MASIVIIGLSITSSWGNGHATTYRGLVKGLAARGHQVTFLERNAPWYAEHRDQPRSPYARVALYRSLCDLQRRFCGIVRDADAVIVGSFVPDGIAVGEWAIARASGPVAFYDIDTPVTLASLEAGTCNYLNADLIAQYDIYLSFTGGPVIDMLIDMGSPRAAPLYCSFDPGTHRPADVRKKWALGYLGTYAADRQSSVEEMLFSCARKLPEKVFVCAGPLYPGEIDWPANVKHIPHLAPAAHPRFYCAQKFTLNITRRDMRALGWSPSVRLFEAAACGVPIISDEWAGIENFFAPKQEILIAESGDDVFRILNEITPGRRAVLGQAARRRALKSHTAAHRARELEQLLELADERGSPKRSAKKGAGKLMERSLAPT